MCGNKSSHEGRGCGRHVACVHTQCSVASRPRIGIAIGRDVGRCVRRSGVTAEDSSRRRARPVEDRTWIVVVAGSGRVHAHETY